MSNQTPMTKLKKSALGKELQLKIKNKTLINVNIVRTNESRNNVFLRSAGILILNFMNVSKLRLILKLNSYFRISK